MDKEFWDDLTEFEPWKLKNYLSALKLKRKQLENQLKKLKKEIRRVKQHIKDIK